MDPVTLIQQERAALIERRDRMRAALQKIDEDLAELEIAIRVYERAAGKRDAKPNTEHQANSPTKPQIRSVLLDALRDIYPQGAGIHQVVDKANKLAAGSVTVSQNTASVTLGRLKNDGQARLEGRQWFFVPTDEETAAFEPPNAAGPSTLTEGAEPMPPPR